MMRRKVSRFEIAEHEEREQIRRAAERRNDPRMVLVVDEEWPELGRRGRRGRTEMETTTPRAHIVPVRGTGFRSDTACGVRTPELDRYSPGLQTYCRRTGSVVAAHLDIEGVWHGAMCPEHARAQVAECLARTCTHTVYRDGYQTVETYTGEIL